MALTDQPYLPLYVDDWMNNSKLKMCSTGAHGLMIAIMCLMHKSDEYGVILLRQKFRQTSRQVENFAAQIAKLTSFDLPETQKYFTELIDEKVLKIDGEKLICSRMVSDANISKKRSSSGRKGADSTNSKTKYFATAKTPANTGIEYVNENGNENEVNIKNTRQKKIAIPGFEEFLECAIEKDSTLDPVAVRLKYDAWVENGWKNGNDKQIKNWKSSLYNTIPHIRKKNLSPAGSAPNIIGRQTAETIQNNLNAFIGNG